MSQHGGKDLKILVSVVQAVHKSFDLHEVYKVALDSVTELENVDMSSIYLVDERTREAVLQAERNFPRAFIERAGRIPEGKGLTWKAIAAGKILNIEDVQKDPDIGPAGRELGHHGALVVPITLQEKTIGVIWFISYKERKFTLREIKLLSTLGSQISIAIARARTFEEMREQDRSIKETLAHLSRKSRYEAIVNIVIRSIHKSINVEDVLENAVDAMSANIEGVDNVSIYLVDADADPKEATLTAHRGYPAWWAKRVRQIPYPSGFTWKTIIEGKPIYCPDTDSDTVIGRAGREMGTKSYASMPIFLGGETVGSININSLQKNAFDEEELKLMETMGRQIGMAINNAKQAEALRKSEEALRKSKEELEAKVDERTAELTDINARLIGEIAYRMRAEKDLSASREQLRALAGHLQSVREEERKGIAREVHDVLGQLLTGLKMDLSWLKSRISRTNAKPTAEHVLIEKIETMSDMVDETIQTVRRIATELRPGVLDDLGLAAAIEWQAQDFEGRTGIKCRFSRNIEDIALNQERATAVFRIFQETLTNIARHSRATRVSAILKRDEGNIMLEVRDNGVGITKEEISATKSLGLLGMRERAVVLGGEVKIAGRRERGTTVSLRIPLGG
ncbi:MAG: GAF domain-containing protein [Deltaproteobacteria bacterium]